MTATFSIRIPQEVLDKLRKLAVQEHRSVNAQIVHLLQSSVKKVG